MGNCIRASRKKLSSRTDEVEVLIRKHSSSMIQLPERVKIVVSKKQLQRLMAEEVQLRQMMLQSLLRRSRRWTPSLAAIPEL
ncbi:hypothetical protein SASPL_152711 [Salvia splendens]|uniref:Uncharacterized protein n=1 Tax=Salvia splendens TaxID=180675 RepID=A0A8X8W454_SALSN|nr:hypothetical protein SASPL_152711 [Salvia splendens]